MTLKRKSAYTYGFALLANAREFVESAAEYAQQSERRLWKFSALHMTTAIELLLKAKLAMTDYRHLVAGSEHVSEHQFDQGEFRSVGIDECLARLERFCSFTLSPHQRQVIKTLQRFRNRITHYIAPADETGTLNATTAAALNLFIQLNNSEFLDEDPYGAKPLSKLIVELHRQADFVKERLVALSEPLRSSIRPRTHHTDECPDCLQDTRVIADDKLECLFCGNDLLVSEFAALISKDGSVEACPDCNRQSVALVRSMDSEPTYECFCCGYFRGPEMQWSDGKVEIPRLHTDR
jgi:hypothetical protein